MNKLPLTLFLFLIIIFPGCSESEHPMKSSARELYRKHCVTCHGVDGSLQSNGAINLKYSRIAMEERVNILQNGRGAMPSFSETLSKQEMNAIASYLETFRKDD